MWREVRDWAEELACRAGLDGLPAPGRALGVAAALVVAGLLAWSLLGSPATGAGSQPAAPSAGAAAPHDAVESTPAAPAAQVTVTVHVVGEVRHPGVYELPGGARARDAVEAAGGLLGDAEQAAVNLARVVADGEQISVPRQGEAGAVASGSSAGGATAGAPGGGKLDLNSATAEQLDALPGVGPATATKIIADRTANGRFRSADDLQRVPGIGPAKFEALKDLVVAN